MGLLQTGLPVLITDSNTGTPGTASDVGSGLRPNLIGDPYSGPAVNGFQYLNPSAFANPTANTWGNLGAYNIFLPGWVNVNGSISKSFWVRERFKWDVKFDMYNVANHLSIATIANTGYNGTKVVNGNTISNASNWGAVTGTTPPRTMEASIRVSF